ncbi:hypothetical protein DID78_03465 [Candidatus Marinamargulisbacteria bacterium SCGC AG-343-D04]|nr:hypothetical protein DID78_03465 [Candidatus Marinamargulisbacteria bacterium SCGC AG-343-D04]
MNSLKQRYLHILSLASPIIFGMLSINILDLVDTAMIGHLGDNALAGTGFASFLYWCCFSGIVGFSGALQTLTARRLGENKLNECGFPLNAGLICVACYAIPLTLIMLAVSPYIFSFFSEDNSVLSLANTYFRWRILGLIAIGFTLNFRGFWNGIKEPFTYTFILIGTHALNIFLNWVLIFGKFGFSPLGVKGAAIGSTIASFSGVFAFFIITIKKKYPLGVLQSFPPLIVFKNLLRIGWPAAVDQLSFSANLLCLFWVFGQLGTAELAVAHVVIVCVLIIWLPGMGFGLTSLTLVSEALGKGLPKEAKQWAWRCIHLAAPLLFLTGLLSLPFSRSILGFFIHNPQTLEMAVFPLNIDQLTLWFACVGVIFIESLIGAGSTLGILAIKTITRWVIFIPGAYITGVHLNFGINGIWIFWATFNAFETLIFLVIWQREKWVGIQV